MGNPGQLVQNNQKRTGDQVKDSFGQRGLKDSFRPPENLKRVDLAEEDSQLEWEGRIGGSLRKSAEEERGENTDHKESRQDDSRGAPGRIREFSGKGVD